MPEKMQVAFLLCLCLSLASAVPYSISEGNVLAFVGSYRNGSEFDFVVPQSGYGYYSPKWLKTADEIFTAPAVETDRAKFVRTDAGICVHSNPAEIEHKAVFVLPRDIAWLQHCDDEKVIVACQRAGCAALIFATVVDYSGVSVNMDIHIPFLRASNETVLFLRSVGSNVSARFLPADPEFQRAAADHNNYYLAFIILQGLVTGSLTIWATVVFVIRLVQFIRGRNHHVIRNSGSNQSGLITISVGCSALSSLLRFLLHCVDFRTYRDTGLSQLVLNIFDGFASGLLITLFSTVVCFWLEAYLFNNKRWTPRRLRSILALFNTVMYLVLVITSILASGSIEGASDASTMILAIFILVLIILVAVIGIKLLVRLRSFAQESKSSASSKSSVFKLTVFILLEDALAFVIVVTLVIYSTPGDVGARELSFNYSWLFLEASIIVIVLVFFTASTGRQSPRASKQGSRGTKPTAQSASARSGSARSGSTHAGSANSGSANSGSNSV